MKSHLEQMIERRFKLVNNLAEENNSDDRSQIYIDDLQSSIDNLDSQIRFARKTGSQYQVINGE